MSKYRTPRTPGTPRGAQHGGNRREEKESKETKLTEARKEKRPDRPTKRQKKSDKEEKGTGAHRADGGDNARTDTPQREEPAHTPSTISKRAPDKEAKEREQRGEDRVQVNPKQTHYRRDHRGTEEVHTNLL